MTTIRRRLRSPLVCALATCIALVFLAPRSSHAQSGYSGVVVFGTSLSDPGNAFVLLGAQGTPPDFTLNPLLIPAAPYAKGGHHFSNGATWIEQYARSVGLGDSVKAALATTDPTATNFAVGAARAYDDGVNYNLGRQVNAFLARSGGAAPPTALYVIEMGGNDVRDAFALYAMGGNGGPILGQAVTSIATAIQRLYAAGAREFLVWTAPNIALTPAIRSLGPQAMGLAALVAQNFNAALAQAVAQLDLALPAAHFARLDAFSLLGEIVAMPWTFDLANVTTACITPHAPPYDCSSPGDYLFWDGIHPTRAGHAILARTAASIVR